MKRLLFLSSIIVYGLLCGILSGKLYTNAQVGGYVSTPNYWKKVGSEIMPITSSNILSVPKFKLSATTTEGYVLTASSTDGTVKWAPASGGGGTISGNSTSGYVTFWSASSTIAGNGSLFWDNTNKFLGIRTSTPTGILTIGAATSTIYTDLLINPAAKDGGKLIDAQVGGVSKFSVSNTGLLLTTASAIVSGTLYNYNIGGGGNTTLNLQNGSMIASGTTAVSAAGGTFSQTSGSNVAFRINPTYNQSSGTAANTDLLINRTETAVGSGTQRLIDAQVGGVSKFSVSNTGNGYFAGNVGIGTTTPQYDLSVTKTSSTTAIIGDNGASGCLILGNSDGSAGLNYITALNGVLSATTTKPINCR